MASTKTPRKSRGLQLGSENAMLRRFGPFMLYGLITLLVVVLYMDNHRWLASLDLRIQDGLVSLGRKPDPPTNVVVVNIDDDAVKTLGSWPWDSERIGYLVGMLSEYHPKAIGLDVELPSDLMEDPEGNLFLAEMIHRAGNVVLPLRFTLTEDGRLTQTAPDYVAKSSLVVIDEAARLMALPYPQSMAVTMPFPEAIKASWALGHVNTWQDVDGRVRRDPLIVNYEGHYYPSMALQLARAATGADRLQVRIQPGESVRMESKYIPTDEAGMIRVDYRGPARTVTSVSAARILEGKADETALNGKIVVVGVTASGYGTGLSTSVSDEFPRAEKLATVTANILEERYITTVSFSSVIDLMILLAIGAFCALVLPRVTLMNRIIVLVVMGFLFLNLNYVLYQSFSVVASTLYPTLEILFFLAFAPFVKPRQEKVPLTAAETPRPMFQTQSGSGGTRIPGEVPAGTPHAGTMPISVGGSEADLATVEVPRTPLASGPAQSPRVVSSQDLKGGITLTPSFDPPSDDRAVAPAGTGPVKIPEPVDLSDDNVEPVAAVSGPNLVDLQRLGRYEILGVLGEGAMGKVFKGRDPAIDRLVALKTIRVGAGVDPSQTRDLRERLVREAKAAGKLSHPNIVTIYDVGTEGDIDYIAMEYIQGITLETLIHKQTGMNFRIFAKMLHQVCGALDYAHKAGIVHRDVKPANIMVLEDFDVKVTDFGIARFESGGMTMTQTGIAMGTPFYIAPEQLRGEAVDRRCDIFSLGVVAYELLTRQRPFRGANISALIYAITQTNPETPSRVDPSIPGLFDFVITKALAKDPRKRYQTAEEMGKDLEAFVEDMSGAKAYRR